MPNPSISEDAYSQAPYLDYGNSYNRVNLKANIITLMPKTSRLVFGKRLLKLANYLTTISPSNYNHDVLVSEVHPCGAVACAFGHAVLSEKFDDINVHVTITPSEGFPEPDYDFTVADLDALSRTVPPSVRARLDRNDMSIVADAYFGPGSWATIFSEDAYNNATKRAVVDRIRNVARRAYGVVP